jgi:hypothetical protein
MKSFKMEVSKKEEVAGRPQYVKQGEVEIFYPTLEDFGIAAEVKETDEEGFPVYTDSKMQYAFDAVLAAVKAQARNKLVSGTATLKDGQSIATTLEALLESNTANRGDALAAVREMLSAFKGWLATTGKKESVQAAVYSLAANRTGLSLQSEEKKGKFLVYLADFAGKLTAAQADRFAKPLTALEEAATGGDPLDDM